MFFEAPMKKKESPACLIVLHLLAVPALIAGTACVCRKTDFLQCLGSKCRSKRASFHEKSECGCVPPDCPVESPEDDLTCDENSVVNSEGRGIHCPHKKNGTEQDG